MLYILTSLFVDTKPQPVFPACVWAPRPEQIPDGPAQQVLAQSAPLKHWPPINCTPLALPTFFTPAGSKAGPPFEAVEATVVAVAGDAAAAVDTKGEEAPPDTKPQPVFPACVCAPKPEQMPEGPAQQVLAQSAPLKHWPPINCIPFAFPTFLTPAGSKAGPPFVATVDTVFAIVGDTTAATADTAGEDVPDTKPQPVLPA